MLVYDTDGNELGEVPVSEKQQAVLDAGGEFEVFYHTPQLLRSTLGDHGGKFSLHQEDDRLVTTTPGTFKQFVQLRQAIAAANKREAN
jgi:hypothetical protein